MKIAFIVGTFPSLSETFILNQITGLMDKGHDITIYARAASNNPKTHPDVARYNLLRRVRYYGLPRNVWKRLLTAAQLIGRNLYLYPFRVIKSLNVFKYGSLASGLKLLHLSVLMSETEFDIIHSHFGPNGTIGACLKEIGIGGRYITTFHGSDVCLRRGKREKSVYARLFRAGDMFTVNTAFLRDQLLRLGCPADKIRILPMGVSTDKFSYNARHAKSGEPLVILTIARLVEFKGHEYAIRAIARVAKLKNISYVIVGDGPLRHSLERLAFTLGIRDTIVFFGAAHEKEVQDLYRSADIFVLPSITASDGTVEAQGVVLLEAQATGLPVISTLSGGVPDGVLDGETGFLVPEKDPEAIADKIVFLIENPETRLEMGKKGRSFVEERYNLSLLNSQLEALYQEILGWKHTGF